jgi:hypothetical protein
MITGWDHAFDSLSAITRVKVTGAAPAEYGASIRTVFEGKGSADALDATLAAAAMKSQRQRRFRI